jgi:hypothetical protein
MHHRLTALTAAACLVFTVLWLILLISSVATAGPLDTFDQVLRFTARLGPAFYLTYVNAALVTVSATAFFAALYLEHRAAAPALSLIGILFVPAYAALNLVVYLSQVTVVPHLLAERSDPASRALADFALRQTIQMWPASAIAIVNSLAYAVLALPSLAFGWQLRNGGPRRRLGGLLLGLSGLSSLVGFSGVVLRSSALGLGTLVGGVLFLLALVFIVWADRS